MVFHSAKESLTREEILDILRRNVKLYKNEPEFVNYIVDLALYLLENVAHEELEMRGGFGEGGRIKAGTGIELERSGLPVSEIHEPPPHTEDPPLPKSPPSAPPESKFPRVQVDKGGKTRVYKVFRAHTHTIESLHCPICGSETRGERICPNCGNVL